MATYFVGIGGSNGNNGTTWALRRLTITSGLTLMSAGDTLVVGPGTYRENPSTGANGSSGSPYTVVGDEGGTLTDGIGGEVRITGSDNDQTATRTNGITCANNWWVFRGLHVDTCTAQCFNVSGNNNIVEQCVISFPGANAILNTGASATNNTYRKLFIYAAVRGIEITHSSVVDNSAVVVENCFMTGGAGSGVRSARYGGLTIRNNTFFALATGVQNLVAPSGGQVNNVNNNIICMCVTGLTATATTDLTENYNNIFGCSTARTNVTAGANSQAYTPLFALPLLTLGINIPYPGALSANSALGSIAGTGVATDDMYATTRLGTSSWGAVQYEATRRPSNAGISAARRLGAH